MEWSTSDQPQDLSTNGRSNMAVDSKLIKPPDEDRSNGAAIQIGYSVDKDSEEYAMNGKHRGKALIFSHYFKNRKQVRLGNDVDEARITTELENLGFQVIVHKDKRVQQIKSILKETSREDHSQSDCLVVVVMSHGNKSKKFWGDTSYQIEADDDFYNENMLFQYFDAKSCKSLHGKPKIFLIQACRGKHTQEVTELLAHRTQTDGEPIKGESYFFQPDQSDFFIFRAARNGTVSWRDEASGTPFIQAICDMLSENRTRKYSRDFMTMMTLAIQKVATQNPQLPNISSTLLRILYLKPK